MKTKQLILAAVLLVVLAVGWIKAMQSNGDEDILLEQNNLVAEADALASRELYVRAIPFYEDALDLQTEQNPAIEEKLLAAYMAFQDLNSYIDLAEYRIEQERATLEEYRTVAELYLSSGKLEEAMGVLETGLDILGENETLRTLYEDHRYGYMIYGTAYKEVIPTAGNTLMPAFDGESWGYINEKGRRQLAFSYESATPFNEKGLAVVRSNGQYQVIMQDGVKYGVDELGVTDVAGINKSYIMAQYNGKYAYYNVDFACVSGSFACDAMTGNSCGYAAVQRNGKWGIIADSGEEICADILEDVAVNSYGTVFTSYNKTPVGAGKQGGKWYLIFPDGSHVCEIGFADMRAPEGGYLIAVANAEGKWGFADLNGTMQIDYQYEDARSFSNGLAAVYDGDEWVYISERNQPVITGGFAEAMPFRNGIAQVRMQESVALLHLEYWNN